VRNTPARSEAVSNVSPFFGGAVIVDRSRALMDVVLRHNAIGRPSRLILSLNTRQDAAC
jgi:hypothetical protein